MHRDGLLFTCSTAQGFCRKQATKKSSPDASGRSPVHLFNCSRRFWQEAKIEQVKIEQEIRRVHRGKAATTHHIAAGFAGGNRPPKTWCAELRILRRPRRI